MPRLEMLTLSSSNVIGKKRAWHNQYHNNVDLQRIPILIPLKTQEQQRKITANNPAEPANGASKFVWSRLA